MAARGFGGARWSCRDRIATGCRRTDTLVWTEILRPFVGAERAGNVLAWKEGELYEARGRVVAVCRCRCAVAMPGFTANSSVHALFGLDTVHAGPFPSGGRRHLPPPNASRTGQPPTDGSPP
jgi:hypothetical protein